MMQYINKNLIIIAGVTILIIAGVFIYLNQDKIKSNFAGTLTPQKAAEKAIEYINKNAFGGENKAVLVSVVEENGLYKFKLKVDDKEYDSYVTKDGKILFSQAGINLDEQQNTENQTDNTTTETTKQEKPDVKLFIMSYCPYGLQMQKAYLPVYNLLKDKADMGIYFVNYIMHEKKEIDENLRQYCIQKEQTAKFSVYLSCFVKAGDFSGCLTEAKIDKTKMDNCISATDKKYNITSQYNNKSTWLNGDFPIFGVNDDLNKQYGVQGSPTLVINGNIVQANRTPEAVKTAICNAFTTQPTECSQKLSTDATSAGFGTTTGTDSGGGCTE